MSRSVEFDGVDRITAGAIGEPGQRTFMVQARAGADQVTIIAEKEQVNALAQALLQLLGASEEPEEGPPPDGFDLELQEPLEPDWRAGSIQLEMDDLADRVQIVVNEATLPPEDDDDEDAEPQGAVARFRITRAQARAMAEHALEIVAAGRPRCQLCGNPIEPNEDHMCPTMNGHRSFTD